MGDFISRQLGPLGRLEQILNGGRALTDLGVTDLGDDPALREAVESATKIIEAVSTLRPAQDPPDTVWREWEALAVRNPFVFWSTTLGFVVDPPLPDPADPSTWFVYVSKGELQERGRKWAGGAWLRLRTPHRSGILVALLAEYFNSPHRDRLKRCPRCRRWFVDMTRNRSSLRCSRACTIAWSNSQRPRAAKKGTHR